MKFLVVGDSCWDIYHWGEIKRTNPEAVAPLLSDVTRECRRGMASNVAANLRAFGVEVVLDTHPEPWSEKHRFFDRRHGSQLLRVDYDRNPSFSLPELPYDLRAYTGVLVSDYDKGYISQERIKWLSRFSNTFIDTKKVDLSGMGDAWFKINRQERERLQFAPTNLIVTDGSLGCWHGDKRYETQRIEVVDVSGAGDTFLAAFAFAMSSTHDLDRSLIFANKCASTVCRHLGVHVIQKEEIPPL